MRSGGITVMFLYYHCDHRDLHVLTHSFPTRRSSDLTTWGRYAIGLADASPATPTASSYEGYPRVARHTPSAQRTTASGRSPGSRVTVPAPPSRMTSRDRKSTRLNSIH